MIERHPNLEKIESDDSTSVIDVHGSVKREKGEPRAGMEPVSLWVNFAAAIVLMIAAGYAGGKFGGFRMENTYALNNYAPEPRPVGDDEIDAVQQLSPEFWVKGKKAYSNCAACHNAAGTGAVGVFPPLVGSEWTLGSTERLAVLILKGLSGPITVMGQPYNNVMPPWEAAMSDQQMAQVMSYVRQSWGNEASLVTEEMAANARAKYAGQLGPWTEAKLLEIPEDAMLEGAEVNPDDPETWVNLQK